SMSEQRYGSDGRTVRDDAQQMGEQYRALLAQGISVELLTSATPAFAALRVDRDADPVSPGLIPIIVFQQRDRLSPVSNYLQQVVGKVVFPHCLHVILWPSSRVAGPHRAVEDRCLDGSLQVHLEVQDVVETLQRHLV